MNIVFDEAFGKVWSDSNSPIVFSVIRQMPRTAAGFYSLCERQIELVKHTKKQFQEAYSITDLSSCHPIPINIAFDYSQKYMPRQFKAGLRFKAFIKPKNLLTSSTLDTVLKVSDTSAIGLYGSFEEALQDINRRMLLHESQKRDKKGGWFGLLSSDKTRGDKLPENSVSPIY